MDRERGLGLLAPHFETALLDVQAAEVAEHETFLARSPSSRLIESALSKWARASSNRPCSAWRMARLFSTLASASPLPLAIDRERALVGRPRFLHRAGLALHDAELVERVAFGLAERGAQRQRLLGVAACLVHAALLAFGIGEPAEHLGFARRVVRRPREREGALEQRHRLVEPTGGDGCTSDHGQRCRAQRRLDLLQAVDLHAQVDHQIKGPLCRDGLPGRAQGSDRGRAVPVRDRAPARGDQIVELERQGAPARVAALPVQGQQAVLGTESGEVRCRAVPRAARCRSAPLAASFSAA